MKSIIIICIIIVLSGGIVLYGQGEFVFVKKYPYVSTDLYYDSLGNEYVTLQQGYLLCDMDTVQQFKVQNINECGLVAVTKRGINFYLHLSSPDSVQRVIQYEPIINEVDTLFEVPYTSPYTTNHRGGDLVFGGDTLYASFGFGGTGGDAQDTTDMRGKIIDITSNSIYAIGCRNPFRMTWNDSLWIGDVGGDYYEEINVANGDENFGFPCSEGDTIFMDTCGVTESPYYSYPHDGSQSIILGVYWHKHLYFTDHYTGLGGKIDAQGIITPIEFPTQITSMAVNIMTDELMVIAWTGHLYKFVPYIPLTINTTILKPEFERPDYVDLFYNELIEIYGDVFFTIDGMLCLMPRIPGWYYSIIRQQWEWKD